jgi:hypothetical protein
MKKYATVRGITQDGNKFRPSSWTEMLVSPTTQGCKITICNGIKCIDVDLDCSEAERVMKFAKDNNLTITEDKNEKDN